MAIQEGNIKLLKSQVMDDVPEGGGRATGTVIVDGDSNSIFADISELDRAGGRVSVRKVSVGVDTPDTEGYYGVNVIVAKPPTDPRVSVTLFTTKDGFDHRSDAAGRMESYLVQGSEGPAYLLENHITGQRVLQMLARPGAIFPTPGETLTLSYRAGFPDAALQYVRVTRVTIEERMFSEVDGTGKVVDFLAAVGTVELSDALRHDFPGSPPSRLYAKAAGKTGSYNTNVADAASYFGCVPLVLPAALGDKTVTGASIYTQLVPSSQTENVVLDQNPAATRIIQLAVAPRLVEIGEAGHSQRIKVKIANRGYNYVSLLAPLPAPGSVSVSYRSLGKWYTLDDAGDGTLKGNGGGVVTYNSGSISVTLQALPDVGSDVIFSWGTKTAYTNRSGQAGWRAPEHAWQLDHEGIVPGSLTLTWTSGGAVKTATANAQGKFSGDATGEVNHTDGMVYLRPTAMIDAGGEFHADYTYRTLVEEVKTGLSPDAGGVVALTLGQVPVAGSIQVIWGVARTVSETSGASSTAGQTSKSLDKGVAVVTTKVSSQVPIYNLIYGSVPLQRSSA